VTRTNLPLSGALMLAILGYGANALAVDCFIDSVAGNDTNTGLAENQAVKTQAKIPSTCTVAKFKRGSQFNEALSIGYSSKVKTFTNYGNSCDPMPKFVMPGTTNTGGVVSATQGGITIDGLYIANSHGDGSSSSANFGKGTCVMLGANSVMQNCEITSCDIGVMLMGTGSKFLNNYVHDLNTMIADAAQSSGVNINTVGGAEGIFVNGSNNEVAYNQFINCTGAASWTGGGCDGGATEVSIGNGATVSGVKIHHNFAYNTCGFFEVSSGTDGGTFADSEFYDNVSVDSGWLFLIQVNNTTLSNVRWENNTVVYHKSSSTTYAPTVSMIYNGTGTSGSGNAVTGTVAPNTLFFDNNLVLFDGFSSPSTLDSNIVKSNNLITTTTAGVVKSIGVAGTTPAATDFDLVSGSPAIDGGKAIATITSDYLNRAVPNGTAADIGAFEFNASLASGQSAPVATMDIVLGKAGSCASSATGGASSTSTGSGGTSTNSSTCGTATSTSAGGTNNTTTAVTGGQTSTNSTNPGNGGQTSTNSTNPGNGGQGNPTNTGNPSQGGANNSTTSTAVAGATASASPLADEPGCGCRVAGRSYGSTGMSLFGLIAAAGLLGRRYRRRQS
jgi:MYXO-CTERM domain-containing protein